MLLVWCLLGSSLAVFDEGLPPPSPPCPYAGLRNLTLYFFHPAATAAKPTVFGDHDMGDALGEAVFVCADNYSVHHYNDSLVTQVRIEVNSSYGPYSSCTDTEPGNCTKGARLPGSIDIVGNSTSDESQSNLALCA